MIGALAFIAMSWILTIFCAWVSESEPPNTVKSLAKTKVLRPLTVPQPVTTPSPGTLVFSMPNSVERCSTNMSNSSKLPLSSRSSMRSRAVSLPRACCASMRLSPPPSFAPARRSSRVSRICFIGRSPPQIGSVAGGSNTVVSETERRILAPKSLPTRVTKAIESKQSERHQDERNDRPGDGGRHRYRRSQDPVAAGGAHPVCGHGAAVLDLGRLMVGVCDPFSRARPELHRLSFGPQERCHRL